MVSIGRSNPSPNAVSLNEVGFYGQGPDGYGWSIGYNAKNGFTAGYFSQRADKFGVAASNSISWSAKTEGPSLSRGIGIGVTSGTQGTVVRSARPAVSNKIIWIHHFNDAETTGLRSVSFQGNRAARGQPWHERNARDCCSAVYFIDVPHSTTISFVMIA